MSQYKAIVIAAGIGKRLRPLTDELPKCMLEVGGRTLLQSCVDNFRACDIHDIAVVTGYAADKISYPNLTYYHNPDYLNNNTLHSLMYARKALEDALEKEQSVILSYSDIWLSNKVLPVLIDSQYEISIMIDKMWEKQYEGRTDNPISDAELAVFSIENQLQRIGKKSVWSQEEQVGEFLGLMMLRPSGIQNFLHHFDTLEKRMQASSTFQKATSWQQSHLSDFLQDLTDQGYTIKCVPTPMQLAWREFDTVQDFKRGLPK
tara:strand:+ start:8023 stop:8805 length:783 start_codon:yes stop_codon:yes gene_type:complete